METPTTSVIKISIKTLENKIFPLEVDSNISIPDLKQKIEECTKVPVNSQRLIFQGKVLKDDKSLSFYAVKDNTTLHMVERPPNVPSSIPQPQPEPPRATPTGAPVMGGMPRNIVLGTITLPGDGSPDLNNLVTNVLSTLGITGQVNQAGGAARNEGSGEGSNRGGFGNLNNLYTQVDRLLIELSNADTSSESTTTTTTTTTTTSAPLNSENSIPALSADSTLNTVEQIGFHLSRLNNAFERLQPHCQRLSGLLQQESSLDNLQERREAQRLSTRLSSLLQQMGTYCILSSSNLNAIRMGDTPGSALPAQPPSPTQRQRHIVTPSGNISIHIQDDVAQLLRGAAGGAGAQGVPPSGNVQQQQQGAPQGQAQQPVGARGIPPTAGQPAQQTQQTPQGTGQPVNPFQALLPMMGPMIQQISQQINSQQQQQQQQQQGNNTQPQQPQQQQQQQQGQQPTVDLGGMMQMLQGIAPQIAQQLGAGAAPGTAPSSGAGTGQPAAGTPQPINLGALLSGFMGGMNQQQQAGQPTGAPQGQTQQQQAGQPTGGAPSIDVGNIMNTLFSAFGGQSTTAGSTAPPTNPAVSTGSPAQSQVLGQPQSTFSGTPSALNNAAMMSRVFTLLTEAMVDPSAPPTVSSVLSSLTATGNTDQSQQQQQQEDEGPLGQILHLITNKLTVPELLSLLRGDWTPIQQLQPVIAKYLYDEVGIQDRNSERIETFASEIVTSLNESLDEKSLPEIISSKVKPGINITQKALIVVKYHTIQLLKTILTPFPLNIDHSAPFANAVHDWTKSFVVDLVTTLSNSFYGGVADASFFVRWFLESRLSFMGNEVSTMASNIITSYVMNTYSSSLQSSLSSVDDPEEPSLVSHINNNNNNNNNININNVNRNINSNVMDEDEEEEAGTVIPGPWRNLIESDEIKQNNSSLQRPFSDSYGSAAPGLKRKTSKKNTTSSTSTTTTTTSTSTPQLPDAKILMPNRLDSAVKQSGGSAGKITGKKRTRSTSTPSTRNKKKDGAEASEEEKEIENLNQDDDDGSVELVDLVSDVKKTNLPELYIAQIKKDIAQRLQQDSDFNENRFPKSKEYFLNHK